VAAAAAAAPLAVPIAGATPFWPFAHALHHSMTPKIQLIVMLAAWR
jgi:hypothetical protein